MKRSLLKKLTALFFALATFLLLLPAPAHASMGCPVYRVNSNTYMYESASSSSKTKRHMWKGEEVLCIDEKGSFYWIMDATGTEGYIPRSTASFAGHDDVPDYFVERPIYIVKNYSCQYFNRPDEAGKGTLECGTNVLVIAQYSSNLIFGRLSNGKYVFVKLSDLTASNCTMTYKQLHKGQRIIIDGIPNGNCNNNKGNNNNGNGNNNKGNGNNNKGSNNKEPWSGRKYVVACTSRKYIFMYDQPSSSRGNNIGHFTNGTQCSFISKSKNGFWKVRFGNKVGYVRSKDLVPASRY